jgi:hypothetical protein
LNINGLCWDCNIPTQNSDGVDWVSNYFEVSEVLQLNQEELREKSFHKIINGFDGVSVGGCPRGIWTLFNPKILHLFKSGQSLIGGFIIRLRLEIELLVRFNRVIGV